MSTRKDVPNGDLAVTSILLVVLAVVIALEPGAHVHAHFEANSGWQHVDSSCGFSGGYDPVNVGVNDGGATNALNVLNSKGWTYTSGSTERFKDHGSCYAHSGQRANGSNTAQYRSHVRYRTFTQTGHSPGVPEGAQGSAHYEHVHTLECLGHHVHSFDSAESAVASLLARPTYTYIEGNAAAQLRCGIYVSNSDGKATISDF